MEFNKYIRAAAVVVFGTLGAVQVNAYTGGVTTYQVPADRPGSIERAIKATASAGPERDATYQRTMRTAQTSAAAAKAARGLVKSLAFIGTFATLATFAIDIAGIWKKNANGENVLVAPDPSVCSVGPCYEYNATDGRVAGYWTSTAPSACQAYAAKTSAQTGYSYTFNGMYAPDQCRIGYPGGEFGQGVGRREIPASPSTLKELTELELEAQIAKTIHLPEILDELDKKGYPVPFPDPEVEDMPQPIVLSPTIKINPDGSKVIEQTTLTPYRGPDGKTINWGRKLTSTDESAPDASGNTIKKTTTTTSDAPPSDAKKDDRPECEKSPDTLGCIKMDTPDGEIPKSSKDVSYVAETLFGSATCPVSRVISQSLTGHPIYLHFTPTCDALATFVKPMVIAIALFMAYLIILPGNRE